MAVGKSVVGRKLARKLGQRFVDLDQVIAEIAGMEIHEIFNCKGEAYFRKVEKQALRELLCRNGQVVATGGGAVMDEENLRLLKQRSLLICLSASPDVLLQRSKTSRGRPLLKGNNRQTRIEALLKQREKNYALAHVSIDTTGLSVNKVVEKIIREIESRSQNPEAGGN